MTVFNKNNGLKYNYQINFPNLEVIKNDLSFSTGEGIVLPKPIKIGGDIKYTISSVLPKFNEKFNMAKSLLCSRTNTHC